jgi:hypothetical protein
MIDFIEVQKKLIKDNVVLRSRFNDLSDEHKWFFIEIYSLNLGMYSNSSKMGLYKCFEVGNPGCIIDTENKVINIEKEDIEVMKVIIRKYV